MNDFIPCRTCAAKEGPFPGYYYVDNKRYVVECSCHKKWSAKQELLRRLSAGNIWQDLDYDPEKDYKGNASASDVTALRTYVQRFDDKFTDKMVYIYGPNGTQKTTLAMWVGRELIKQGKSVLYTLMETLSVSLTPDFNAEDDSRQRFIQKALDVDLLIIDESFDRKTTTIYKSGYQLPFLSNFLKSRFEIDHKAVIFISNTLPNELITNGFEVLQSLIARNTINSTLNFRDVFIKKANEIDSKGLFK